MRTFDQKKFQHIIDRTAKEKLIHGSVFHVQSLDKSVDLVAASGNLHPRSNYFIASINKMMLSAITLRLCGQKILNWDDPLSKFFSSSQLQDACIFKGTDYSDKITIHHLISQTSGFRCYFIDKGSDGRRNMDRIRNGEDQSWPLERVFQFMKRMELKFIPGSTGKANYSEINFRLIGAILEKVLQKDLNLILEDLFSELKMEQSFVLPANAGRAIAPFYYKSKELKIDAYCKSSRHNICSNVFDQMKFIRAFFEGHFFPEGQIDGLKNWNNIFFPFKYGTGLQKFYIPKMLSPFKAVPEIIGHCGSIGSVAFYIPDKEFYVTGTVNQHAKPSAAFKILLKIVNAF